MSQFQRKFDIVLFDLGHTLFYFSGDWDEAMQRANAALVQHLIAAGYQLDTVRFSTDFADRLDAYHAERETEFFELSTATILRALLAEYNYPDAPDEAIRPALDAMYAVTQDLWQPEDDAKPMLDALQARGYRLGVISNAKDERDVSIILERSGLSSYFEHVIISAAVGRRKPDPRIFEVAVQQFGVPPQRAVMVGDTLGADILGAHNMGIASVWITRRSFAPGNRAHAETIFPDARIAALSELPALLANWE